MSAGGQRLVSAVDEAAAAEGIAAGMTLADARALHPDLAVAEADFAADAAALARLAQGCGRYSPWTAPCGPDGIWLDVSGCAHFHGGEDGLAAEVVARLGRLGIAARTAIAGSAGTAWGVARHGGAAAAVVPEGGERAALAVLPVAALRLAPELVTTMTRLGLRRVGDLYPMPRPSLVLRFGAGLATRLDQALGRCAEPLSPLPPPPLRWTRRRFAEPIATAEAIGAAAEGLLAVLCRALAAAGEGARRLVLTCYRVDGTPLRLRSERCSRATRRTISCASSPSASARSIQAWASRTWCSPPRWPNRSRRCNSRSIAPAGATAMRAISPRCSTVSPRVSARLRSPGRCCAKVIGRNGPSAG